MSLQIRQAEENDKIQIFELVKRFATSFNPVQVKFNESFDYLMKSDSSKIFLAIDRTRVIGYLLGFEHYSFYANGRVGWVEEIMVSEDYRRQGVGQKLMREFEKWVENKNGKLIGLATRRASDFYKAIGYEESAIFFRKLIGGEPEFKFEE